MKNDRTFRAFIAVGRDRPGLVHGISARIHRTGANIEDSRMAVLGGEFAMVLLVAGTREQLALLDQLKEEIGRDLALEITTRETTERVRANVRHRLRVSGLDRPGIVDRVTSVLASRGINVETLDTRLDHQPLTG